MQLCRNKKNQNMVLNDGHIQELTKLIPFSFCPISSSNEKNIEVC